jgi:hypothetical protein
MPTAIVALLGIMLVSALVAGWISQRKIAEKPVKIMMFVGYFWLMTFLQLVLFSVLYFIGQKFFLISFP